MATDLEDLKELFQVTADAEIDQRQLTLEDLQFGRLGQQWPDAIAKARRADGRPMLTINLMPSFIRQVVNDARQNRPQVKVKPVGSSGNIRTAAAFDGIIKNIEAVSKADMAYDCAMDFAVSGGLGYFRVDIEYEGEDSFDKCLRINRIPNVFSVFGDPFSKRADSADWNSSFVVDFMSKDEFKKEYKGAEEVDWESTGYMALQDPWLDDDRILICEAWLREKTKRKIVKLSNGEIMGAKEYENAKEVVYDPVGITVEASRDGEGSKITHRVMTGVEIIETTEWAGKYIPIIPVYGEEINIEGKRLFKSLINNAKDAQRMMNYWRTTSTELVALAPRVPWLGEEGAFDVEGESSKWATANTENHAYLQYKRGFQPPQRLPLDGGNAIGAMGEAMAADRDIKNTIGMHEASLGQKSNETSGKAISLRQREGDISTFHFVDNLNRSISHSGTVIVDLIPLVYTGERVVRIIQPDGVYTAIKVTNQPIPGSGPMPPMAPAPGMGGGMPPASDGLTVPPPASMGMPGGPPPPGMMGGGPGQPPPQPPGPPPVSPEMEGIEGIYDLGAGTYDVVVDTGKSFTTQREEFAAQATEFARAYPQAMPLIGDLLVKSLDWPQAEEIAARLKAAQQGQGISPKLQKQIEDGKKRLAQLEQENAQLKTAAQSKQADIKAEMDRAQVESAHREEELKLEENVAKANIALKKADVEVARYQAETARLQAETARVQANNQVKIASMKAAQPKPNGARSQ